MLTFTEAFSRIKSVKVLVVGDFLFDVYTKGKVERISPEAPVPVLLVSEITQSPGGAGNVALNLQALGAEVSVVGRVGRDDSGEALRTLLTEEGIETRGLVIQEGFKTPLKNRFLADGQQLMRTDYEVAMPLTEDVEKEVERYIRKNLFLYDIIAISDYGKGFLTHNLLRSIFHEGKKQGVRIVVDPKGKDFSKYSGAYLIKPNNKEAYIAASLGDHVDVQEVAKKLFSVVDTEHLLITRSDKGMILFSKEGEEQNFPAVKKDVVDVTGAGDTALAMITFGLANDISFAHTIALANIASGLAVEHVGCAAVRLADIANRLLEREPFSKIFWEDTNLFVLEKALDYSPIVILDLNEHKDISSLVYHHIKEVAAKKNEAKLIVHIRPTDQNKNFIHLLASMHEIDFVFARAEDPKIILQSVSVLTTI